MNKCEYCKNEFKTAKILNHHQKTAKFCLTKQKKQLICEHCNNISYSDKDFEYHQNHCIVFYFTPKHCSWLNQIEIWFGILYA